MEKSEIALFIKLRYFPIIAETSYFEGLPIEVVDSLYDATLARIYPVSTSQRAMKIMRIVNRFRQGLPEFLGKTKDEWIKEINIALEKSLIEYHTLRICIDSSK